MKKHLEKFYTKFRGIFGKGKTPFYSTAPGRVNLIGEHTDYHNGFVFPAAISLRTTAIGRRSEDEWIKIYSINYGEKFQCRLDELKPTGKHLWSDYTSGALKILKQEGFEAGGIEALVFGEIPPGGGLSSSASVIVSMVYLCNLLWNLSLKPLQIAKLSKKVENDFVGVPCGIMDQMAAVFGKEGEPLFIDCKSLEIESVPMVDHWKIVVCDTGVKHKLGESEYAKRQEECRKGLNVIKKYHKEVSSLRDVKEEWLEEAKDEIEPVSFKRIRYVLEENKRVLQAKESLRRGDEVKIGELFLKSHEGLRDKYQVSCRELDVLVEEAYKLKGIVGARMTGAGFGGNTVNIVKKEYVDDFVEEIKERYKGRTNLELTARLLEVDKGVYGGALLDEGLRNYFRGNSGKGF